MQADQLWRWHRPNETNLEVSWCHQGHTCGDAPAVVLIHGFGANTAHWRHTIPALSRHRATYALDLIGFGGSSQPKAQLHGEQPSDDGLIYSFDLWGSQVATFCREVVQGPVQLVGNSIGGVVALRAAQLIDEQPGTSPCQGVVLIDCAQRLMDDKQLATQPAWMAWVRPVLKTMVRQRWLSTALFRNAARPSVIRSVLKQAYPSGANIDDDLVNLLYQPTQRPGAAEAFRGFINLFNDHLAPDLLAHLKIPVDLIWGERDPWEPLPEAQRWAERFECIRSISVIPGAGHCPHDEAPKLVNTQLINCLVTHATSTTRSEPTQQAT